VLGMSPIHYVANTVRERAKLSYKR